MIALGQVSPIGEIEAAFEVVQKDKTQDWKFYGLYPWENILTILSEDKHHINGTGYGLIPFWSTSKKILPEAPIDGYKISIEPGKLKSRIINIPEFRKPIRETRCIVPVDYFIIEENGKAALFFLQEHPFALGGIYDNWKKNIKDKTYIGSSILTMPAEGIFKEQGFTRQPFILPQKNWKKWLKDISLTDVTGMLCYYPDEEINGYYIDKNLLKEKINSILLVDPVGPFFREHEKKKLEYRMRSRYRKGVLHDKSGQERRTWRG